MFAVSEQIIYFLGPKVPKLNLIICCPEAQLNDGYIKANV